MYVQKVFLLEAGDVMYEFWWNLFDKIRHREQWKHELSLNMSIHECLEKQFPTDASRYLKVLVLLLQKN